jgi:hypothetical protein
MIRSESRTQSRWLLLVLDHLLPDSPDGDIPGAVSSGVCDDVYRSLQTEDYALLSEELELVAVRVLGRQLNELDAADLPKIIDGNRELWKRYVRLVGPVVLTKYFSSVPVRLALGLRTNPPFPTGSVLPEIDTDLLEPVFSRGPIYKEVS